MAVATEALIYQMATVAAAECNPDAIVLFGSHATGTAGADSDVDLLVIMKSLSGNGYDRREVMVRLWRALSQFPIAKDILVYSRDEIERWRDSRNHVIARALKQGKVIYGTA